ncbi:Immunity protein 53 [Paenibacillus sp. UNCCL117]|uniref:immunity 53 family protein n=1 Tax=unclassified Paenibacillus TaxID=185978 RepID=UPI000888D28C|nr:MULTISPECIES: immunity 53 family protein [unclassified Paenibacillus]SDC26046.1 Immunity protein 53 [Paenibacillus sp. cl123]SFW19980.1 Immunity protein 53 [Paenibacillus sp. UNCCL117]
MTNNLVWLQQWFYEQCDGDWEHMQQIYINTLDNPGWSIRIDLLETSLENENFNNIRIERTDTDWLICRVENHTFMGSGGVFNLNEVIEIFKNWAVSVN